MKLSTNFSLEECLKSSTADKHEDIREEQYNPPKNIIENLKYVVNKAVQPLRNIIKYPIKVTSGWRCNSLNTKIKGSKTSQHLVGEALDLQLNEDYLTDDRTFEARNRVNTLVIKHTGKPLREGINSNFYLFAIACLNMEAFDVDQIIHEYGAKGEPAWVHISASNRQNKRQILCINSDGAKILTLKEALSLGV